MSAPDFPEAELDAAVDLLEELLRIDTTNPPGNERAAAEVVARVCREAGLEPELNGTSADRLNLTARWSAAAENRRHRPLVLSCHLDTVPADPARWTHDPWSGHNDGVHVWGRGAIDMKGFAAMGLAAISRLRRENLAIDRDVIFAAVCDEEAGTEHGSRWLVDERPDLLGGDPEYVINELGGFTVHRDGRSFHPVQVAEKGVAWLRLTVPGQPGHSSLPTPDSAVRRLAAAVDAIGRTRLPWHAGAEAKAMLAGFAAPAGAAARTISPLLAHPVIGPRLLPVAVPDESRRRSLEAILRNTATPTRLRGGKALNVVPGSASADIDGRLAPGQSAADLIAELDRVIRPIVGPEARWEILEESAAVSFPTDTPLYHAIERSMTAFDPDGHVVPTLIPGFTDSRNYARLGANCYGFYPLPLPPDLDFAALFHGDDERIPIAGFRDGVRILTGMLREFLTG